MRKYSLHVLGFEMSFKADAPPERVERAKYLLEERYEQIAQHGRLLSREKQLLFISLGMADDVIALQDELENQNQQIQKLLTLLENIGEE